MSTITDPQTVCFNPRLPGGRRRVGNNALSMTTERFNPRLPGGRRPTTLSICDFTLTFQSTPSGGKATVGVRVGVRVVKVSIHAFRGEGDIIAWINSLIDVWFQSTPSGGKATPPLVLKSVYVQAFQSTPSGGKATIIAWINSLVDIWFQSTPSGGKATMDSHPSPSVYRRFNPRLPGERRRALQREPQLRIDSFNPRLPGGRRPMPSSYWMMRYCFNPRLPGGRRQKQRRDAPANRSFNPRLPGGRRRSPGGGGRCDGLFQSTPSGGKATLWRTSFDGAAGSFNPRLPGGRRRVVLGNDIEFVEFQSTPSEGKATKIIDDLRSHRRRFNPRLPGGRRLRRRLGSRCVRQFQSTPSGGKATELVAMIEPVVGAFQSTPSGGKATSASVDIDNALRVSIHAFRGEGDARGLQEREGARFQSTPSGGKATIRRVEPRVVARCFNPRLPGGRRPEETVANSAHRRVSIHAFRGEGDRNI